MKLFGFNVLEECDPISIECILKDNDWKSIWMSSYDRWSPESDSPPAAELMNWLQNVPAFPPVVSKVGNGDRHNTGIIKIWIRPEDYVLFILKFK